MWEQGLFLKEMASTSQIMPAESRKPLKKVVMEAIKMKESPKIVRKVKSVFFCRFCGRKVCLDEVKRFYPFCCDRCRLADLGNWAEGRYRLKGGEYGEDMERPGGKSNLP